MTPNPYGVNPSGRQWLEAYGNVLDAEEARDSSPHMHKAGQMRIARLAVAEAYRIAAKEAAE